MVPGGTYQDVRLTTRQVAVAGSGGRECDRRHLVTTVLLIERRGPGD
jgi:hypothetical protein